MKYFISLFLVFCNFAAFSQSSINLNELSPKDGNQSIEVHGIDSDINASSFVIWIKDSVKAHYHEDHQERVLVLDGTGVLTIDNEVITLKGGDYVYIPKGKVHSLKVTSETQMKVLSIQAPEFLGKDRKFLEKD